MVGLRCRAAQISQGGAAAPPYQNKKRPAGNCGAFLLRAKVRKFAAYPHISDILDNEGKVSIHISA
jgi:hypothetical protein